jgi:hypothetical protein
MASHSETVKELQDAVIAAGLHYEIWWVFRSEDTRGKYLDAMNQYVTYFKAAIAAHFTALLVCLYRLYETRRDTHNIPQFIDRLESEKALDAETLKTLRAMHEEAKPLWKKVSILRNEVFGHRSLEIDTDTAFKKAQITGDDLKELVAITKTLLNHLTLKLHDSTHAFNLSAASDTLGIMETLHNARAL